MLVVQNKVFLQNYTLNSECVCFVSMKKHNVWIKNKLAEQNVWIIVLWFMVSGLYWIF